MLIERLVVGPLETNCYIVGDPSTGEAAVIDPGGDARKIIRRIESLSVRPVLIINTHGHGDHIAANAKLKRAFPDARIAVHEADAGHLDNPDLNLTSLFGLPMTSPPADLVLHDGDEVCVGGLRFEVIHVPGHTPGGIGLYCDSTRDGTPVLFCGDAVFAGGIGRTDFPGGSYETLVSAIRRRLLTLPAETVVYPGHGEVTTIGREAASNPFLA